VSSDDGLKLEGLKANGDKTLLSSKMYGPPSDVPLFGSLSDASGLNLKTKVSFRIGVTSSSLDAFPEVGRRLNFRQFEKNPRRFSRKIKHRFSRLFGGLCMTRPFRLVMYRNRRSRSWDLLYVLIRTHATVGFRPI
jgi:hypothetical protein